MILCYKILPGILKIIKTTSYSMQLCVKRSSQFSFYKLNFHLLIFHEKKINREHFRFIILPTKIIIIFFKLF